MRIKKKKHLGFVLNVFALATAEALLKLTRVILYFENIISIIVYQMQNSKSVKILVASAIRVN
jgi:hypothetical protein